MQFYVLVNDEQQGPFSESQIKGYIAMGHFQSTDLAWHEGLPEWKPLHDFPQFAPKTTGHRTPNYKSIPTRNLAPKKKKKTSGIVNAIVFIVVFAAAAVGGYYGFNYWQAHKQKSGADAQGTATAATDSATNNPAEPKTLEELNRSYEEPPAGQNAATLFQQGFDALQITNADKNSYSLPLIGKATMPAITAPVPAGMKTTITTFLEKNKPALDLFERGAQLSGSRYPVDLTKGSETPLPHLAKVKQATQITELQALIQADAHQGASAAKAVSVALSAAETLQSEPLLISQLVRVAGEAISQESLEQVMNRAVIPAESLSQLQTAFDRASTSEASGAGFSRALVAERINGLAMFDLPPEKLREALVRSGGAAIANNIANLKEQRQFFEDSLNQLIAARNEALPGRLKANDVLAPRIEEAKSKSYFLCLTMLPALGKVTAREAVGLAHLELGQTAIALEKFRAANSKYPDALTELAPKFISAVPNDPFDGQPLRYRKAGEGFIAYSIGPDLRDDNGIRKPGSDDPSFIVARPPKQ